MSRDAGGGKGSPRWRRYLRFPNVVDDVDEELAFHVQSRIDRNVALGMAPADARRIALARFGDMDHVRHALVEHDERRQATTRRAELASDFLQDVRFGLRSLQRAPAFTTAAVLTLAIGIGANAAIFSVVHAVLLRPLPFARPHELVTIGNGSGGEFLALRERLQSFSHMGAYVAQTHPIQVGDEAVRVTGAAVTPNMFALLGASPVLGRGFTEDEGRFGANTALVLSHGMWQRDFGGASDVVGRRVLVEGAPFTAVGVMSSGFRFPDKDAQYWQPLAFNEANVGLLWAVGGKTFVGRLKPSATFAQADREVAELFPTLRRLNPLWDPGENYRRDAHAVPLQRDIVGSAGPLLWLLFGCVGLVLLIGCINVANLLLARATARERELAMRAALGGGRGRLIRQLTTESLLLAGAGALVGIAIASAGIRWLVSELPAGVPRSHEIGMNGTVLTFTAVVAVLTALVFGLVPALRATSGAARSAGFGVRSTAGRGHQRVSGFLVAGQIALAVLLVIGATLLVRSFAALRAVSPGFETQHVIAARLTPPSLRYAEPARLGTLYSGVMQRVARMPSVHQVALVDRLPLAQQVWGIAMRVEGQYEDNTRLLPELAHMQMVSPAYFTTMGIPVLQGRAFSDADRDGAPGVAIVSASVARTFWPNGNAIGKRVGYPYDSPWLTVVGVVPDTKQDSLRDTASTSIYIPWQQRSRMSGSEMWVVARTSSDPALVAAAIRKAVADEDASVAVSAVRSMDEVMGDSVAKTRFTVLLVGLFAGAALLLGAIGIYGVMSYVVSQRTREMGIRIALGATTGEVLGMVVRRGALLAGAGTAAGIVAGLFLTRSMASFLYGVKPLDPVTFASVPVLFAIVAVAASLLPGQRATRVDPKRALSAE